MEFKSIKYYLFSIIKKEHIKVLIIGLLLICVSFPEIYLSYSKGIDPPLLWVYNSLFDNGLDLGKNIIFPHGPLAFFMYPLQGNILFGLFIKIILQLILVFNIFKIVKLNSNKDWLSATFISFVFLYLLNINFLILSNIILCYLLYYENKKIILKYLAFILTAFAFYIKAYVAVVSGTITLSFLLFFLITQKKYLLFIKDSFIILGLMLLLWVIMYGGLSGFIKYCIGMINLAQDNSSATSYYPQNNWIILTIFIIITFSISFIQKSSKAYFFGLLLTLSIFSIWKYGMAREDNSHARTLFIYMFFLFTIFLFYVRKNILINIVLITTALLLYSINLKNVINYTPREYKINGIYNLIDFISDHSAQKINAEEVSKHNIISNKLPENIVCEIGRKKVDIYPWDYSIIPANDLNWQPRPVIQSYAVYTSWLDEQNAKHFYSDSSPEILIWDMNKITPNYYGGDMESLDNRYLLNDEPQTILSILCNYKLYFKNTDFLIYEKRKKQLHAVKERSEILNIKWNEWIEVPSNIKDITRVKVFFGKTIMRRIKSFFYKDDFFYIYYKLSNGMIHKYRIVPKNSVDGIWINPYINNASNNYIEPQVEAILFKCSNMNIADRDIEIIWENITINSNNNKERTNYPLEFFGKDIKYHNNLLIKSFNDLELHENNWTDIDPDNISTDAYSGKFSNYSRQNSFSTTYTLNLDTLLNKKIQISANCWIKSNPDSKVNLVISLENESMNNIWNGVDINNQIIDYNEWNNISNYLEYSNDIPGTILKAYLWNTGNQTVIFDSFEVRIEQKSDTKPDR